MRRDMVQFMALCFTDFLYSLRTTNGMKSRLKRLEKLPTSELCSSEWHYLRNEFSFVKNVLSRQKRRKWKIPYWEPFCSTTFIMAHPPTITIPIFPDTPGPKTCGARKQVLCSLLICLCVRMGKGRIYFQTLVSFRFCWLWRGECQQSA